MRPKRPSARSDCTARSRPRGGVEPCGRRPTGVVGAVGRIGGAGSALGATAGVALVVPDMVTFLVVAYAAGIPASPPLVRHGYQTRAAPSGLCANLADCASLRGVNRCALGAVA